MRIPHNLGRSARDRRFPARRFSAALAALALLAGACAGDDGGRDDSAPDAENAADDTGEAPFYEGKTVELVVPFDTGGGTDTIARFLAPVLSDHIPGNPTVQVINLPGADTLIGHNDFAAREPDGESWFLGGGTGNVNYIFGNADAQYDYDDWDAYLGVPQGAVVYVSPSTGIEEPADLLNPDEPLVWPAGSPEGSDLARLFTAELLGAEFDPVFGYDGSGAERIAFEQGEGNMNVETTTSYHSNVTPLVEDGVAIPLYSQGQMDDEGNLIRDPSVPDLPHVVELYEEIHGGAPDDMELRAHRLLTSATAIFNKILFMHADVPEEAKDALRTGIEGLLEDPRYDEAREDALGGYDISYGDGLQSTLSEILNPNPEVVDWVIEWAREEYDSQLGT